MSVQLSKELNHTTTTSLHGSLRLSRVNSNRVQDFPLLQSSTQEVLFELPNRVMSMGSSSLCFDMEVPAQGAVGSSAVLHKLGLNMIESVALYSQGGTFLADLRNFSEYHRAVALALTSHEKLTTNEASRGDVDPATAREVDQGFNVFKSSSVQSTSINDPVADPTDDRTGVRLSVTNSDQAQHAIVSGDAPVIEPQYIQAIDPTQPRTMSMCIPFTEFYHSILGDHKDIYFGQNLQLRIRFNGYRACGYTTANANATPDATSAVLTNAPIIKNPRVYLALETDDNVVAQVVAKTSTSGNMFTVPFVWAYQTSTPQGSNQTNTSQKLNRSMGARLLNVYSAQYNADESQKYSTDIDNSDANFRKVTEYQTFIDSKQLQEFIPRASDNEIYMIHRPLLDGSVLGLSSNVYNYNNVIIDSFRSGKTKDWLSTDNNVDGLSLDVERVWAMQRKHGTQGSRNYSFYVTQRECQILPTGQIVMV